MAETWAFFSPGPKELPHARLEWAMAFRLWPMSISQAGERGRWPVFTLRAWERVAVAPVLSEVGAPLPKTGGGNFSGCGKTGRGSRVHALLSK